MIKNHLIFLELYSKKSKDYTHGNFRYSSITRIHHDHTRKSMQWYNQSKTSLLIVYIGGY